MTEPVKIPVVPDDHKCCWHPGVRNTPGHGPHAISFNLTVELMTAPLPKYLQRFEFCCFCGKQK